MNFFSLHSILIFNEFKKKLNEKNERERCRNNRKLKEYIPTKNM